MDIGNIIKSIRIREKISIRELERKSGISNACISQWERNIHIPNIEQVDRLLKALNASLIIGEKSNETHNYDIDADSKKLID